MKEFEAKLPRECKPHLTEALKCLVQLYDGWCHPDQAAEWRKKLAQQQEQEQK